MKARQRHTQSYEDARWKALTRKGTFCHRRRGATWENCFAHVGPDRAREFAVSSSGVVDEGPIWVARKDGTVELGRARARRRR